MLSRGDAVDDTAGCRVAFAGMKAFCLSFECSVRSVCILGFSWQGTLYPNTPLTDNSSLL
jgi:hypothetical protein